MDMNIGNSIFLNKTPSQKLVLAPGAIIRGNTVPSPVKTRPVMKNLVLSAHTCKDPP